MIRVFRKAPSLPDVSTCPWSPLEKLGVREGHRAEVVQPRRLPGSPPDYRSPDRRLWSEHAGLMEQSLP